MRSLCELLLAAKPEVRVSSARAVVWQQHFVAKNVTEVGGASRVRGLVIAARLP